MSRTFPTLLALALLSPLSCGPQPEQARSRRQPAAAASAAASASSHPTAFTGKPARKEDPIDALKARTYFLATQGDLVHAGTTAGVVSWSFKDRAHPTQLATMVLPGSVSGLTLFGPSQTLLAVSTGPTGLVIVDTSSVSRGRLDRLSEAPWKHADRGGCHAVWNAVVSEDKLAYLACGTGGVAEVDLSNPAHPRVLRSLEIDGYVREVSLLDAAAGIPKDKASSRRVAVAAGDAGFVVVDFEAGGPPRLVSRLPTTGESRGLDVREGLAFLADGGAGLRIIEVRDPAHPRELSRFDPKTVDLARGVTVRDKTAFLCLGDSGLFSIDVSDPRQPRRLAGVDPPRAINRARAEGNLLYAANDAGGILLWDVAKPERFAQLFPPPAK